MEYATGHKRDVRGAIMDENSYMSPKKVCMCVYGKFWVIWLPVSYLNIISATWNTVKEEWVQLAVPRFILMADYVRVFFLKLLIVKN